MNSKEIVAFLRKLKVHEVLRPAKKLMPHKLKEWAEQNTVRELVSVNELWPQYQKACLFLASTVGPDNLGDYLEFGVCHGTSLNCMSQVLQEQRLSTVRLFGFDSFEGMPAISNQDDNGFWQPGQFRNELAATKCFLSHNGVDWNKTFLIKGWYSDTLTPELKQQHQIQKASLIMIDCDIYTSAKEALTFCKDLIKDIAIIFFDDWGSGNLASLNLGEKRAFQEFLDENPHFKAEEFGSYQYQGLAQAKIFKVVNTLNFPVPG
ncbi:class I SAM-dependent methyltransferase [Adhaeribacter rhizoryzae]|uniref:Class I SAM-dependent methyltransferase n=1 Tax=Adhaeribacter rhizoryzae TaxID=2607907 RepID=A0A5M6D9C7_9BACT|nr:class I SAM-dependent methyltransferase [Adhaeribacter rhizoryzae]KAA5544131.1 class I SAM-dependent methyltransferase [Adhaeribacter rhizoryzae]